MTWATTFRSEIALASVAGKSPASFWLPGIFSFSRLLRRTFFLRGVTNPALVRLRDKAFQENDNA
jgi:hypothetical protein